MRGQGKPAPPARAPILDAEATGDPGLIEALLDVYREFDFNGQLLSLLRSSVAFSGAQAGFAFSPGEGKAFVLAGSTLLRTDPRLECFRNLLPGEVRGWLADGLQVHAGPGPFGAAVEDWPGELPAFTVAASVDGTQVSAAGALWLHYGAAVEQAGLRRCKRLLEMSRWAVDNAMQVLSMRDLVIKDDTASCFNRRYFEQRLPEELSRAGRYRTPVSLIFLDMDNLKQVNNAHGHSVGSKTLEEVSLRIRSKIRKFDKLFRFGGDEFCIVLPETEWHGAMEVADRVRDAIVNKPFLEDELGPGGLRMSASLGIASYPLHARTKRELVQRADRAMQKVKKSGKNAIGIAEIEGVDEDGE